MSPLSFFCTYFTISRASQLSCTSSMWRTSPLQIETNFCDRHSVVAGVIRSAA